MKNLVIFGASRAGKTTLAREVSKKFPNYHIIHGDAVRNAFAYTLPQNNINANEGKDMKEDFARFLGELLVRECRYDRDIFSHIIETCDVSVENAIKYFQNEYTVIVYLGYSEITAKKALQNYRKYDKITDWSYRKSDEELLKHAQKWVNNSKIFKQDCEKNNLWYVDTSYNREEVLKKLLNELIEKLKN